MLELERIGNEVYFKGAKLKIDPQTSKGANKEYVNIEGLEGNIGENLGKKWYPLKKLNQGKNIVEDKDLKPREVKPGSYSKNKYTLTTEEQEEINKLQAQIDAIKEKAKERYVPKKTRVQDMSIEELEVFLAQKKAEQEALKLAELKKGKLN